MRRTALPLRFVLAALIVCALSATALAQHDLDCPAPVMKSLAFLEGRWTVEANVRFSPSPKDWDDSTGTAVIGREARDCLVLERYSGTRRGKPFASLRLFGARPDGTLQAALSDSAHGPIFLYEGGVEAGGPAFYYTVETPNGPVLVRLRYRDIQPGSFIAETQRSTDQGKSWDTTSRAVYRRVTIDH